MIARMITRFLKREDGPTAIEYAVMLALIVVVCMISIQRVGRSSSTSFNTTGSTILNAR